MKRLKPTTAIMLDTRRVKQDEKYPLKLRVTFNRERQYYAIGRDVTKEEWEKLTQKKAKASLRDLQLEIIDLERKAEGVLKTIEDKDEEFSFVRFEEYFFGINNYTNDIFISFDMQINTFKENGQISNATAYLCAKKSLIDYVGKDNLKFKDINTDFLEKYEQWMINKKGNSVSTLGIYLRNLRALFNIALSKGIIKIEQYPFGRKKYVIPVSESVDKSIPKEVIRQIYNYKPEEFTTEDKAKDLWFFSYLCNGMNIKDVCRLKFSNIDHEKITFKRAKTEKTSKKVRNISILLNEEIIRIIRKWGNEFNSFDEYVFPFFYNGILPIDERRITQNLTGVINDWMKRIMNAIGQPYKVTTYSARHSHSNILKEGGAPIKLIADNLGHSSIQTTERHYLTQFNKETKKEFGDKLMFYLE